MNGSGNSAKFWELDHAPEATAVVDAQTGVRKTYGELRADGLNLIARLPKHEGKSLFLLLAQNRYECIVAYLAALNSGNALLLVDATLNRELLEGIVATYQPDLIFGEVELPRYRKCDSPVPGFWKAEYPTAPVAIHPTLAVLLNTSGSTGSPKLVRLTLDNLQANAASIATYLELTAQERPITSLPMAYSYGLSVINSHLLAGACLVLTEHGVLRREFWDSVDRYACTSFSGVPYTYQMLLQTGLLKKRGTSLRTLTQAGGRLAEPYVRQVQVLAAERRTKLFVMYGQTEATARISYLPWDALPVRAGSIGIAIPGGKMRVEASGELVYEGPNVMMGYAQSKEDLARGDELRGVLKTGDLARQDDDGFFYITGRIQRFLKLFGKRFNLDEVELLLQRRLNTPAACFGQDDLLMVAIDGTGNVDAVEAMLRQTFGLPRDAVRVTMVAALPRTINGKIDYQALAANDQQLRAATTQVTR